MIKKALIVCSKAFNEEQISTLRLVKRALKFKKIKSVICDRQSLDGIYLLDCDLVIPVGGDGTFLRAAHFIKDNTSIFGVNSDIKSKEGFYMKSTKYDFEKKLASLLNGDFKIRKIMRLEAFINKKMVEELALNEFYFGSIKPYLAARYSLEIGNNKERQRSSGILAATPTGTNAWVKACNGPLIKNSRKFAYVVREPYEYRILNNYKMLSGILEQNACISIISEMKDAILVADSLSREYPVDYGRRVDIRVSDKFLSSIDFS